MKNISLKSTSRSFRSIIVDPEEIRSIISAAPPSVVSRLALGGFSLRPHDIEALVARGLIEKAEPESLSTGVNSAEFMAWSVELFNERYWSLYKLSRELGAEPPILRREFEALGLIPVMNNTYTRLALYDVEEIIRHEIGAILR